MSRLKCFPSENDDWAWPCFGDACVFLKNTRTLPGSLMAVSQLWVPRETQRLFQSQGGCHLRLLRGKQYLRNWISLSHVKCCQVLEPLCLHSLFKYKPKWRHHLESVNLCSVQRISLQKEVRTYCYFFHKHITFVLSWVCFPLRTQ